MLLTGILVTVVGIAGALYGIEKTGAYHDDFKKRFYTNLCYIVGTLMTASGLSILVVVGVMFIKKLSGE